jgi:hypothetical protein
MLGKNFGPGDGAIRRSGLAYSRYRRRLGLPAAGQGAIYGPFSRGTVVGAGSGNFRCRYPAMDPGPGDPASGALATARHVSGLPVCRLDQCWFRLAHFGLFMLNLLFKGALGTRRGKPGFHLIRCNATYGTSCTRLVLANFMGFFRGNQSFSQQ